MIRVPSTNFICRFNKSIVVSLQPKPNPNLLKVPSILEHYVKCFSSTDQRWKYAQYNKVMNGGVPPPSAAVPFRAIFERQISTEDVRAVALNIKDDLRHLTSAPKPALALGAAVLAPIMLPSAYMVMGGVYCPSLAFLQLACGAALLAFHGGSRWGLLLSKNGSVDWINVAHSGVPTLVAGSALVLPTSLSMLVIIGGLAGSTYFDASHRGYPPWFRAMRIVLGAGAVVSIATVLVCSLLLETSCKPKKKKTCKCLTEDTETTVSKVAKDNDIYSKCKKDNTNTLSKYFKDKFNGTTVSKSKKDDSKCTTVSKSKKDNGTIVSKYEKDNVLTISKCAKNSESTAAKSTKDNSESTASKSTKDNSTIVSKSTKDNSTKPTISKVKKDNDTTVTKVAKGNDIDSKCKKDNATTFSKYLKDKFNGTTISKSKDDGTCTTVSKSTDSCTKPTISKVAKDNDTTVSEVVKGNDIDSKCKKDNATTFSKYLKDKFNGTTVSKSKNDGTCTTVSKSTDSCTKPTISKVAKDNDTTVSEVTKGNDIDSKCKKDNATTSFSKYLKDKFNGTTVSKSKDDSTCTTVSKSTDNCTKSTISKVEKDNSTTVSTTKKDDGIIVSKYEKDNVLTISKCAKDSVFTASKSAKDNSTTVSITKDNCIKPTVKRC
ncbi:TRIO and F-actin-binding protein-like [Gigantopelta aegis]|uniref:TRIO and F-actin-binding protein-like n=1 Tax=Gigantopelta aegis TaxID=1735272 RepID=UPI001B8889B7|nr:TRIO and F-actin-binding protein-like [Gigantopelta aegis]